MIHKTKIVKLDGKNVRIDAKIANLISMLWQCGIKTQSCCEAECNFACNHKLKQAKYKGQTYSKIVKSKHCYNNIWIAFTCSQDVEKLYNIVAADEWSNENHRDHNSMYSIMGCDLFLQTSTKYIGSDEKWSFAFIMNNDGVEGHWGRPMHKGKRTGYQMWCYDSCKKNDFVISPQVTFPQKHLVFVEQKLTAFLNKKAKKK